MKHLRGFTLLEMIVAIAILAGMFAVAAVTFSAAIDGRDKLSAEATRLEARQRALTYMTLDFEQLIARPVRDNFGATLEALLSLDNGIGLTRLGWANPFDLRPRSQLQRVEYLLQEGKLVRRHWPVLDNLPGTEPVDTVLLEEVVSLSLRFLHKDVAGDWIWLDVWPDPANPVPALNSALPFSIELELEFADGRFLRRFFRTVVNPWA